MFYRMLFIFTISVMLAACSERQNFERRLDSSWEFKNVEDSLWRTAIVPGAVQLDLLNHNLIPDPYFANNADSIDWVENENWLYRTKFNLNKEELSATNLNLILEGLDTYADIFINGNHVFKSNNMFIGHELDIGKYINQSENLLEIVFTSPLNQNRAKLDSLPFNLPSSSSKKEDAVAPLTRKAAYQFGWDFAPHIVTMGVWQPVYLRSWSKARLDNIQFVQTNISEELAEYQVIVEVESDGPREIEIIINNRKENFKIKPGMNKIISSLKIENPKLWWPNGLGEPHLYEIPIELHVNGQIIQKSIESIGIRHIELIQEADEIGTSFYFKINGKKVFMKGANWSPLSSYPSSVPDSTYKNRINAIKEANMNMLRVWGGGTYESDLFYKLCDQNGILVWQDFMFANTMYYADSAFLKSVQQEVKYQIKRLRNHPSIAHWNGNNEIDVAWHNWGWQQQFHYTSEDSSRLWQDYSHIFHSLIPNLLNNLDSNRSYTTTSPLSNWGTPENFNHGSMHYWGVWHGNDNFSDYKRNVGRFMAEYGFQSFPQGSTIKTYVQATGIELDSILKMHQRSYVGNGLILKEIGKYFDPPQNLEEFVSLSQATQAIALKTAIEAHRAGRDHCGGTLFWQLNDTWPGPSWSIIDYFGNKKTAFDVVKDRYKQVILVSIAEDNAFSLMAINDLQEVIKGTLRIEMFNFRDERLWLSEKEITVGENQNRLIYRSDRRKLLDGMSPHEVYLKITLSSGSETLDIENYYFVRPKEFKGEYKINNAD